MTDTPMTPDRERMIRIWHEELFRLRDVTAVARREALGDLLAEVDRLRAELEARPTRAEVLNEAADHFDATLEGRYVTRYFGHQVAAELRVLPVSPQGAAETEVERLRARVAELEALKPAQFQDCQKCGAGYEYGQPCSACEFTALMAAASTKGSAALPRDLSPEQARRIERDRPETNTVHDCNLPLVRRLDCGHCPHEVCEDCDRCPHTCRCASADAPQGSPESEVPQ
ncbi:hypothetical protein ACWCPT_29620 [Streptomyces sp. NPDC002308]